MCTGTCGWCPGVMATRRSRERECCCVLSTRVLQIRFSCGAKNPATHLNSRWARCCSRRWAACLTTDLAVTPSSSRDRMAGCSSGRPLPACRSPTCKIRRCLPAKHLFVSRQTAPSPASRNCFACWTVAQEVHDVCATGEAAARACAGGASPPAPEPPPTHPRPRPPASHTTVQAGSAGPHQADVAIDAAAAAPLGRRPAVCA